jgi:hypothetical protein
MTFKIFSGILQNYLLCLCGKRDEYTTLKTLGSVTRGFDWRHVSTKSFA